MVVRNPIRPGEVFGRLTVIEQAEPKKNPAGYLIYRAKAQCECGTMTVVYESKLRYGSTKSCGCLLNQTRLKNIKPRSTHGMTRSPTWISWRAMLDRCERPGTNGYERYGGAGVTVCAAWHSFESFFTDMGLRPDGQTLDRIFSTGNYEPGNCKWSTWTEQESNRRDNRFVIIAGQQICFAEAARLLGIGIDRLTYRAEKIGDDQKTVDTILREILTAIK